MGYPPGEFPRTFEAWVAAIHPEDKDRVTAALEDHLKGVAAYTIEYRVRRKDGEWRWLSARGTALRDDRGEPYKIIGSITDITEQKDIQNKIKFNSELLRHIGQSVIATDLQGNVIYWNNRAEETYGWSSAEAMGQSIVDLTPAEQTMEQASEIMKALSAGNSWSGELLVKRKDGSIFPADVTDAPIIDSDGKLIGIIGISSDITERNRTEEEIRNLAKFPSENPFPILRVAKNGTLLYVNESGKRQLPEWNLQIEHSVPNMLKEVVLNTLNNGEIQQVEFNQSEKTYLFYVTPIFGTEYANLYGWNITERMQTEEKLKKSEEKYRYMFANNPQPMWIYDLKTLAFLEINNAAIQHYGYTREEFLLMNLKDIRPKEDIDDLLKDVELTREVYNPAGEWHHIKKDGEIINVEIVSHSIIFKDRKARHVIVNDITERKRAEKDLIEAKEKAEEINRLKSNFLANMSHELRTPLVGILGFADILRQEVEPQEVKAMADTIYKSGKRLSETLNLILDLSKFESEKWDIKHSKIDLVSKTEEVINSFEATANKKGLTLQSSFSQDSLIINFDERAFNSILNNLINNAIKFTSEGSVTTTILLNNDFVEIKVIDTGIGIAEQDYLNIFEEFRQASEGYNRNFEGSGLGLSITKKLVEKFGGSISVESEIGKGSTFTLKLPVTNVEEKEKDLTSTKAQIPKTSPEQISVKPIALLVDDDPFVFTVLKRYTHEYIELETTVEAEFAIKKLKNKQYDLIFMDINLRRGMDGKEATKKIRTMKGYENIPIIATTAYAMLGDREEFLTAGCTHYLSKPFSQEEILSLLEDVFTLV
jgi:PAS domain S-box-containing protein